MNSTCAMGASRGVDCHARVTEGNADAHQSSLPSARQQGKVPDFTPEFRFRAGGGDENPFLRLSEAPRRPRYSFRAMRPDVGRRRRVHRAEGRDPPINKPPETPFAWLSLTGTHSA
jgi:hypothetical protein